MSHFRKAGRGPPLRCCLWLPQRPSKEKLVFQLLLPPKRYSLPDFSSQRWHSCGDSHVMSWMTLHVVLPNFTVWSSHLHIFSTLRWKEYLCQICSLKKTGNEMRFTDKMLLIFPFWRLWLNRRKYPEKLHMFSVLKSSSLLGSNWPVCTGAFGGVSRSLCEYDFGKWESISWNIPKEKGDSPVIHYDPIQGYPGSEEMSTIYRVL